MPALDDPAAAVAASLCLLSRGHALRRTSRHPGPCAWCDYPAAELSRIVAEFVEWASFGERHGTSGRHATRAFAALPRDEQAAQVAAAQGLGAPEPMAPPEPPGADAEEEPVPWL